MIIDISCIYPEAAELVISCKCIILHNGSNHFTLKYNLLHTPNHPCHAICKPVCEMVHQFSMTFNLVKCFNSVHYKCP